MTDYDIFNGDADGICALQQLRLATPRVATLITGVKRSIKLLASVPSYASRLTVLDISLDKNRADLLRLLDHGATVDYVDHHVAGAIPDHPNLQALIDLDANICTSLLVDRRLQGAHRLWAVVGAFGDNLFEAAKQKATTHPATLNSEQLQQLEMLGTLLNYNGYGMSVDDLFFHPAELFLTLRPYSNPLHFITDHPAFATLQQGYADDMAQISSTAVEIETPHCQLRLLPDCDWSRRASGVYGNLLARQHPKRAHALATELPDGSFRISVRAPLDDKQGADRLCMQFPSGGGRAAAAGINALPAAMLDSFSARFQTFWNIPATR